MPKKPVFVRRPLIAGNHKMNLNHLEAISLTQKIAFSLTEEQLTTVEVAVLPAFTNLRSVQTLVEGDRLLLSYGAQDVSPHASGAYTGDVSGPMLAKLGCTYVVIGHSERREHHHEDDALVNAKVRAAFAHGLIPILCVGEGLQVREAGAHVAYTLAQLDGALTGVSAEQAATIVLAYEPVWAIGTGKVATPEDAQEVCAAIRDRLLELYSSDVAVAVRILYGGSVKANNVAGIMAKDDVDGALVGGASLTAEEFATLCRFPEHAVLT
ncbi:MAG TPA: triose-phosphate isomerase [Cryptosporangiaceae bacterium]|nr:triose-phosphate isomerase [Cryptosporangiaceae bacterium]